MEKTDSDSEAIRNESDTTDFGTDSYDIDEDTAGDSDSKILSNMTLTRIQLESK